MKKIIYLFVFTAFLLQLQEAKAGFGDVTPQEEEPTTTDVVVPGADFGSEDKFSRDNFSNEQIMNAGDGDGPPPPPPIPLDGGASLLLIGGIGLGIRKLLGKKK